MSTLIETRKFAVEGQQYRLEVFQGDDGDKKFANGSRGFYCYASTYFNGEEWVAVTPIARDRERALTGAESLCRRHWKKSIKQEKKRV